MKSPRPIQSAISANDQSPFNLAEKEKSDPSFQMHLHKIDCQSKSPSIVADQNNSAFKPFKSPGPGPQMQPQFVYPTPAAIAHDSSSNPIQHEGDGRFSFSVQNPQEKLNDSFKDLKISNAVPLQTL